MLIVDLLLEVFFSFDKSLAFDDWRKQSLVNKRSRDANVAADYSRRIREGLPGMPGELAVMLLKN